MPAGRGQIQFNVPLGMLVIRSDPEWRASYGGHLICITMTRTENIRYITIGDFHVAPLAELSPDGIKAAAKQLIKDREGIKRTTSQNLIADALGFKGKFAGFKKAYEEEFLPFMKKHGLKKRENLLSPRHPGPAFINITPKTAADRLFKGDWDHTTKILSGHNLPWGVVSDFYRGQRPPFNSIRPFTHEDHIVSTIQESGLKCDRSSQTNQIYILGESHSTLSGHMFHQEEVTAGDIVHLYQPASSTEESFTTECNVIKKALREFQQWTALLPYAWLKIIRFNDKLIFLKAPDGSYDYLILNAKDHPFEHNIHAPFLRNGDIPKSNDTYHFRRWLYFEYKGWFEKDEHLAEINYYAEGGTGKDYPGLEEVLKAWFIKEGIYEQPNKTAASIDGFHPLDVDGKKLYVSDLITIEQLRHFLNSGNPDYTEYRNSIPNNADLHAANQGSLDLPAATTWYDANAYATWLCKTQKIPVRLLEESEHESIYRSICKPLEFDNWESDWKSPDFTIKYKWQQHQNGLTIARDKRFGEWLNKHGCAVNTAYLGSLTHPSLGAYRDPFCPSSTGEYKGMRVGFRLCYEADN